MRKWLIQQFQEYKGLIIFLILMTVFRSALADWNAVPTGSMQPTIIEGDRILVNKLAYDLRLPFSQLSLLKIADPQRGDIIIFNSKAAKLRLVKRVVGVPGDALAMRDNNLIINGETIDYQLLNSQQSFADLSEDLLGLKHSIRISKRSSPAANFDLIRIPAEYYLVLGDNRNNSADSRFIGLVPRDEIIGRTQSVIMSLNYDNFHLPRGDRFFHPL